MSPRRTAAALPCVFMTIAMTAASPSSAEVPMACQIATGQVDPTNRQSELLRFERIPEDCLKTTYMHCAAESEQAVLGVGAAMMCSMVSEALLKRSFGGNFESLLAWWRGERRGASE